MNDEHKNLKAFLANGKAQDSEQWRIAQKQSSDYAKALGIGQSEIEGMGCKNIAINVGGCVIIPKNVCGVPHGGTWTNVLQARLTDGSQFSVGGGTTYFTTLDDSMHKAIIQLLQAEEYKISANHLWP